MSSRKKRKQQSKAHSDSLLRSENIKGPVISSVRKWQHIGMIILLAAVAVFYASTFRPGHDFSGDNCMYVMHAQSLLAGRGYADTNFVFNPEATIFPATYPPALSFLLIPFAAVDPTGWEWMKLEMLFFFLMFLYVFYRIVIRSESYVAGIAVTAAVGFCSYFWELKDYILAEVPFMLFAYLAFELNSAHADSDKKKNRLILSILTGTAAYLSYASRSVGLLVIASLVLSEFIRNRRINLHIIRISVIFSFLYLLQNIFLHADLGHITHKAADFDIELIKANLTHNYPIFFSRIWNSFRGDASFVTVLWVSSLLSLTGTCYRIISRKFSSVDLFYLVYVSAFLFVRLNDTMPQARYLMPAFPVYIWHAVTGAAFISGRINNRLKLHAAVLLSGLILILNLSVIDGLRKNSTWDNVINSPKALEMYDFLISNTDQNDAVASHYPRVLGLYTGRKSYHYMRIDLNSVSPETRFAYFRKNKVKYYMLKQDLSDGYLNRTNMKKVFDNGEYYVYEL